jgi:hypothetical protein
VEVFIFAFLLVVEFGASGCFERSVKPLPEQDLGEREI